MARSKPKEEPLEAQLWAEYQAVALPPEQRAAARHRAEERAEQARLAGVYERALEMAGTIRWSRPWQLIRTDEWK